VIVTRRRRKPFPWKRILFPLGVLAIAAFALWCGPSRALLAPVWKPVAKPFDVVSQQETISGQAEQLSSLMKQLADARAQIADRDKQISQLQTQINQSQQDAAAAQASKPGAQVAAVNSGAQPAEVSSDLSQSATADMRRTAEVWAAMDSEASAKLIQKLPDAYVAREFALMSPDSVGVILENLPPAYAARLTQEHPELKR